MSTARPRVVIVGAGFGGLTAAQTLAGAPVDITMIDKRNYHLFQPLLYQVATAGLSPADIASPIRGILRRQENTRVLMAKVNGIDKARREVIAGERRVPYDYLILATGARHAYFGRDEWEPFAPGLKKIDDATDIRRRLLLAFEQAEIEDDPAARARLLSFVVIGGGPTGVELAGAIAELSRHTLVKDFRRLDPCDARIVLLEGGERLLPSFPETLSSETRRSLQRLGVDVRTRALVTGCDQSGVTVGDDRIEAANVIWAAGVAASPAAKWLDADTDRTGRVVVEPDLSIPGHPEIMAIGDTALMRDQDGRAVPGNAPAAKQAGKFAARRILALLAGSPAPGPFIYRHLGNLATIGRQSAVVDFGWVRLKGRLAWLLWGLAHVYFLIGFRNRMVVMTDWLWSYLTYGRGARLITGPSSPRPVPAAETQPAVLAAE